MQDILRVQNTFPSGVPEEFGAGDGIRTRNPQLGKLNVVTSYYNNLQISRQSWSLQNVQSL